MNTPKPCPFCPDGGDVQPITFTGSADDVDDVVHRHTCGTILKYKIWQTRPIEDDLRKRIAELSQAVGLITTLKPTMVMDADHPLDMAKEVAEYVTARIAELEAMVDRLIMNFAGHE